MCKVISIISCKGGVGKTTTAVNLSASIQNEGRHVCVIDFDHQHNLTMNLGVDQVSLEHHTTIYDLIETAINDPDDEIMSVLVQDSIISTHTVDIIPATGKLAALENIIPMATSREHLLEYIVSFLKNRYDYIFIDCHPGLDNFSQNALTASDSVIIPVEAHIFGAEGLEQTAAMIRMVKRRLNPKLYIEGVLITKYQGQTNYCKSVYQQIEEDFGHDVHIYPHKIKYAIKVAEGVLRYKGHVTLGVGGKPFQRILEQPRAIHPPFEAPPGHGNEDAVWLAPTLVCTVEFMERTKSGGMRQPVFKGLREDKEPEECIEPKIREK